MSTPMADPHIGMLSFQEALLAGLLEIHLVKPHEDVFSHYDIPEPNVTRLTYVRLTKNLKSVISFVQCIPNGHVEGHPCVSLGYAVPKDFRNKGLAKQLLKEVIQDQIIQAGKFGYSDIYFEAIIDVENLISRRVAKSILGVEEESITDSFSGKPAVRYTAHFKTIKN